VNIARNKFRSEQPALPGGCAKIVTGDWSGRIIEFIHDFRNMGRCFGVKLRLRGERHLHLVTSYRVCQQSRAHIGPETVFRQQELLQALDGFVNPDPRKQFIIDLTQCIKQCQSDNDDIMITMDVNEQIGDYQKGLTSMMRECRWLISFTIIMVIFQTLKRLILAPSALTTSLVVLLFFPSRSTPDT
jgi:hypothetical protein